MGSQSDLPIMQQAADFLKSLEIPYELTVVSAHRTPERMFDFAKTAKNRGVKVPNVAKPVAKTAKAGGKILFKFINLLLRMGTLLLIAWIIYLLGLHFLANAGSFGNIVSRLTSADQELIAYLAVGAVLLLYEVIIFFCVLGGSKKQGRRGNSIDNGRGLTSFIIIAAGSYLSAMFAVLIPQAPAALLGIHNALTVYGGLKDTLLPICIAGGGVKPDTGKEETA